MAISGQKLVNIGIQNQSSNSDSLYTAFNKIQDNFSNLFAKASPYNTFTGNIGISTETNEVTGTVTINNTGVTKLTPGTGITLSGSNGEVVVSVSGNVTGNLVAGVTRVGVLSNSLTVANNQIVSSGNITIEMPKTGIIAGQYTAPTVSVDEYGRITNIANTISTGTVTSVAVAPGNGIAVSGSPITSNGTITIVNTGVTRLTAGTGITLSGSNGAVTISAGLTKDVGTVTSVGISSNTLNVIGGRVTTSGNLIVELPDNLVTNNLTCTGNVNARNLIWDGPNNTTTANSKFKSTILTELGNVSNVKILGGTNGHVLQTDGTGNLSWTALPAPVVANVATTTAGGGNKQIQFNDSGAFNGNSALVYNTSTLHVGQYRSVNSLQLDHSTGKLVLYGSISGNVSLVSSPTVASPYTFQFPNSAGTIGYLLQTDGSGNTSWTTPLSTGSVTLTVGSGLTSNPTASLHWTVYGNVVTLNIGSLTGTGNGGVFELFGLPGDVEPSINHSFIARVQTDTGAVGTGLVTITNTGTMRVSATISGTDFTNGLAVGLYDNNTFVYPR